MAKKSGSNSSSQPNHNSPAEKAARDNRANQLNPNNPAYHSSRGNDSTDK